MLPSKFEELLYFPILINSPSNFPRKLLNYPPFCNFIQVLFKSFKRSLVKTVYLDELSTASERLHNEDCQSKARPNKYF